MVLNLFFVSAMIGSSFASPLLAARGESKAFTGNFTSNIFPPPSATAHPALFPNESQLGYAGVTMTGIEPAAAQTGTVFAKKQGHYPLVVPEPYSNKQMPLLAIPIPSASITNSSEIPFDMTDYWGNLTPVKSVDSSIYGLNSNVTPLVPKTCELERVFVTYRHGARYPTAGNSASSPSGFALKIQNATRHGGFNTTGPLGFLSSWNYTLGSEILTPYGRMQNFLLGVTNRILYGSLLNGYESLLVLTTESGDRMVKTALNFAAGFFGIPAEDQYELSIVVEQQTSANQSAFNTTGSPYFRCLNSNTKALGGAISTNYTNVAFLPAATRLNSFSTLNFTTADVSAMLQLCAYETDSLGYSSFCGLFTKEDFEAFEYAFDLAFYYSEGFGSPVAAAQGLGNLQQFMARLTNTPIPIFNSTTNSTLDSNPITFPLDQPLYFDAMHEVTILDTLTAFNLTGLTSGALPLSGSSNPPNVFRASRVVPFATSFTVQVMQCDGEVEKSIRFMVNDAVIPIDSSYPGCLPNADGLCPLPVVIEALHNRIGEIDFQHDCFGNYTTPIGKDINGRAPKSTQSS